MAASRLLAIIGGQGIECQAKKPRPGRRDRLKPKERNMMPLNPLLRRVARKIKSLFTGRPEDPHEYAMVGAPVRPKPPKLRAKAVAVPERYDST